MIGDYQMPQMDKTEARLDTHEEVCKIRYEAINARLKRIEVTLMTTAGAIITGLAAIAVKIH